MHLNNLFSFYKVLQKQIECFKWGQFSIKCRLLVRINILTQLSRFFCSNWGAVSIILVAFAIIQEGHFGG